MKVKISDIMDAVGFNSDMSDSFLNTKTKEVCMFAHDEIQAAENDEDLSNSAEWYCEAVTRAKHYVENLDDYLPLPEQYDFNEYRVMEKFISQVVASLPLGLKQSAVLSEAIEGKGAFRRFKIALERLELREEWYRFRDQKLREFVEFWCIENKIDFE